MTRRRWFSRGGVAGRIGLSSRGFSGFLGDMSRGFSGFSYGDHFFDDVDFSRRTGPLAENDFSALEFSLKSVATRDFHKQSFQRFARSFPRCLSYTQIKYSNQCTLWLKNRNDPVTDGTDITIDKL
jgi:hypothetical protein